MNQSILIQIATDVLQTAVIFWLVWKNKQLRLRWNLFIETQVKITKFLASAIFDAVLGKEEAEQKKEAPPPSPNPAELESQLLNVLSRAGIRHSQQVESMAFALGRLAGQAPKEHLVCAYEKALRTFSQAITREAQGRGIDFSVVANTSDGHAPVPGPMPPRIVT